MKFQENKTNTASKGKNYLSLLHRKFIKHHLNILTLQNIKHQKIVTMQLTRVLSI